MQTSSACSRTPFRRLEESKTGGGRELPWRVHGTGKGNGGGDDDDEGVTAECMCACASHR